MQAEQTTGGSAMERTRSAQRWQVDSGARTSAERQAEQTGRRDKVSIGDWQMRQAEGKIAAANPFALSRPMWAMMLRVCAIVLRYGVCALRRTDAS